MCAMRGPSVKEGEVYVGNLPPDITIRDIEDIFFRYGKINGVNLKTGSGPNGPGPPFAFLEFEDPRDAHDAIKDRHGYKYHGHTLRVELPRGISGNRPGDSRPSLSERSRNADEDAGGSSRSGGRSEYGSSVQSRASPVRSRRSENRIIVTGLPKFVSKQDLKDHLRDVGDISNVEVMGDGTGTVEFARNDDMRQAIRKMDDTKFKTRDGEVSYIRIKEDCTRGKDIRARSRSPNRRSRGSPKYSPPPQRR